MLSDKDIRDVQYQVIEEIAQFGKLTFQTVRTAAFYLRRKIDPWSSLGYETKEFKPEPIQPIQVDHQRLGLPSKIKYDTKDNCYGCQNAENDMYYHTCNIECNIEN